MTDTKRKRIRAHRQRILEGLITTLDNDLYGNGAEYIYQMRERDELSETDEAEIKRAGDQLLKQLRGMVHR